MNNTKEYLTLLNTRQQLRIGFKKNMLDLASSFHQKGLIDDECYESISEDRKSVTQKAEAMTRGIMDSVQLSVNSYGDLRTILSEGRVYNALVQKLDEEYSKQGGEKLYAKIKAPTDSREPQAPTDSREPQAGASLWKAQIRLMNSFNLIRYYDPKTHEQRQLRILDKLAADWEEVGLILGFSDPEIRTIRNAGAGKTPVQCLRDVLGRWMQNAEGMPYRDRFPCTWKGVHNLLWDSLHANDAEDLKNVIESSSYSDLLLNYEDGSSVAAPVGEAARGGPSAAASVKSKESNGQTQRVPQQQPTAEAVTQQTAPASGATAGAGVKRKRKNYENLAEWLEDQGVDDVDIATLKGKGVSEMLFMTMEPGDKWSSRLSEATIAMLPLLQEELKNS